jgi:hypothetical protein
MRTESTLGQMPTPWKSVPLKESVDAILSRLREIFQVFVGEFR